MDMKVKILIADESLTERHTLRDGLRNAGFVHVEEAANGEDALQMIRRGGYDAAVLNIMLTHLDGIGLLRACRDFDFSPATRPAFLMLAPVANQSIIADAIAAGADSFLMKPFDMTSLCEHLRRLSTNDQQAVKGLSEGEQKTLEALLLRMRDNLKEV